MPPAKPAAVPHDEAHARAEGERLAKAPVAGHAAAKEHENKKGEHVGGIVPHVPVTLLRENPSSGFLG